MRKCNIIPNPMPEISLEQNWFLKLSVVLVLGTLKSLHFTLPVSHHSARAKYEKGIQDERCEFKYFMFLIISELRSGAISVLYLNGP